MENKKYLTRDEMQKAIDAAIADHERRFVRHGIWSTALISTVAFTLDGII